MTARTALLALLGIGGGVTLLGAGTWATEAREKIDLIAEIRRLAAERDRYREALYEIACGIRHAFACAAARHHPGEEPRAS